MDRKTFLIKTAGALLLATPAYVLLSCSSSSGSDSDDYGSDDDGDNNYETDCLENGARGSISANHGHSLTVSSADVNSGTEKTYSIAGSAGHSHDVTVSVANFNTLKSNQQIIIASTTGDNHTHQVTVSCV